MPSDTEKIALIAISNPITSGRINTIMKQKGWSSKIHSDGDEALAEEGPAHEGGDRGPTHEGVRSRARHDPRRGC